MASATNLQCGIIGAGIAGLAAAIALRRAGHDVEIFERSQFKNEVGAAIMLTPNGSRILTRWGIDLDKCGATDNNQFRSAQADTLDIVYTDVFPNMQERYGDRYCAFHRVDMHSAMRELVEKEMKDWAAPAKIRLASEVVEIDYEEGKLTLIDGSTVQKDFVVLADGCRVRYPNPRQETARLLILTVQIPE